MNKFEKQLEKWNNGVLRGAQAKLAKVLKVSTATTALWTTGKRHPSKGYIAQMATLFGLDAYDVLKLFDVSSNIVYPTPENWSPSHILREKSNSVIYPLPKAAQVLPQNTVKLPFLATIPLRYPHYPEEDILEWWSIPRRYAQGAKYLVRSKNIALPDAVSDEDLCWVKPCQEPADQQITLLTDGHSFQTRRAVCREKKCHYIPLDNSKVKLSASFHPIGVLVRRIKPL